MKCYEGNILVYQLKMDFWVGGNAVNHPRVVCYLVVM